MARTQTATNSVIITNVPDALFEAGLNASLRLHFERVAKLRCWAPLPSFGRILAVYASVHEAQAAKTLLDKSVIEDADADASQSEKIPSATLRVYAGPHTPEHLLEASSSAEKHLPVPVTDKNFLISPPGSPPVGWEQIREDPPNTVTLADDLMLALSNLALAQQIDESQPGTPRHSRTASLSSAPATPAADEPAVYPAEQLVIPAMPDRDHPAVLVSNMDAEADSTQQTTSGITIANTPRGVKRPGPGSISQVKATVESMLPGTATSGQRITPTARPPV